MNWWNLVFVPFSAIIAFGKGRSMILWSVITIFTGFIGTLIVTFTPQKEIKLPIALQNFLQNRWIRQEMKGINSPADL